MIRRRAGLDVRRFCALAGIATTTWYRRRQRALGGRAQKGPWPRPVRDRVAAVVHAYALRYPAWGHRKIWALTVADGHEVSQRTVHRILDERGLLNGRRYQAERRELARARKQTFANRRPGATASGRPTSASSRPAPAGPGSSAASSTTRRRCA